MSKRWKLFTLMALFAFGVTLISWPHSAQANLGTLSASVSSATAGQTVTVTGSLNSLSGASVTMVASTGNWVSGTVSTGEAVSGVGTPVLAFTSNGSTVSTTLTGTYTCGATGTVTFTLSQNPAPSSGSSFLTTTVTCAAAVPAVVTVTPPAAAVNTAATISTTCGGASELLNETGPGQFVAFPPPVNATVVSPNSVSCNAAGTLTVTFICTGDGIVTFTLNSASGTLYCGNTSSILTPFCPTAGYPYGTAMPYGTTTSQYPYATNSTLFPYGTQQQYPYGTQYPYGANGANNYPYGSLYSFCNTVAPVANVATSLTLTASSSHMACGSSAFVTVRVNSGYGNLWVTDGTQVTMTASGGTLNVTSGTTAGGNVTATFLAPTTSGAVTISAASGNATNTMTINVDCPVVVVAAPVPQVAPQYISPPNTGDAGLAD